MTHTLLIVTDTTADQVNGVTRCIDELRRRLSPDMNLVILSPNNFTHLPFPGYKEIRLSLSFPYNLKKKIFEIAPDYIHIETEGPIGISTARVCRKYDIPYTTTFHTKFPEYLNMRNRIITKKLVHKYLHYVHNGAVRTFVSNPGMVNYLKKNKYGKIAIVPLGIDHSLFFPGNANFFQDIKKPKLLYVGRIAIEKNIEIFTNISDEYEKYIVGDGPDREELEELYPNVHFLGVKKGSELADIYRSVDAFVFPSKTDTLGLVNLEAMASGKPIIAYDLDTMRGIVDVGRSGILVREDDDLERHIPAALMLREDHITKSAEGYNWDAYVERFIEHQAPISAHFWEEE